MKRFILSLFLCLAAPSSAQEDGGFSIRADTVSEDQSAGVTTYQGNAKAEIASLVIEAHRITIFHGKPLPTRIEASGEPVELKGTMSSGIVSGTARKIVLDVAERRLTLVDYVIEDSSGNRMKGREANIVLEP